MRKIREFLPKSEQFFSKKGKGRSPPSPYLHACLPYNKEKKKKTANGNACLKGTETGPCDVQGKAFFFQLYTNETHHRYLSRIFAIYTVGTLERERSV